MGRRLAWRKKGCLSMKKIECIIRPDRLIEIQEALNGITTGITVTHVKGYGTTKGETQIYRGTPVTFNLLPKIKIEMVISEDKVEEVRGSNRNNPESLSNRQTG